MVPAVRAFARRRYSAVQDVDDFCQDALIRIIGLVQAERVERPEDIGAFALGVCRHIFSEKQRKETRREALWQRAAPLVETTLAGPAEFDSVSIRLEGCLSALTHRSREVIQRTWFLEQDGSAIGEALSMSTANVRVVRHRALGALRTCMDSGGLIGH